MEWLDEYGYILKYGVIAFIVAVGSFQAWLVNRKAAKTQETIRVFGLVELYQNACSKAYVPGQEEGIPQHAYEDATRKSEDAYRIQMGGYLQQYFSYKQMSAAINQRKVNAIYEADDILPSMMKTAKEKAAENIKQIKAGLTRGGPNGQVPTRRRRRR